MYMDDR